MRKPGKPAIRRSLATPPGFVEEFPSRIPGFWKRPEQHQPMITPRKTAKKILKMGRTAIAAGKTVLVKTDVGRWKKVSEEVPVWDERNRVIAGFIPDGSQVLDLGAGARLLKDYLKPGCQYQPCDIIRSSPDVIFCDFNSGIYPVLSRKYDCVVCSGVFEYVRDPAKFLSKIRHYGRKTIFSYNPFHPGYPKAARLACGWVNHFTQDQLEKLFLSHGLRSRVLHRRTTTGAAEEIIYELVLNEGLK